MVSRRPSGCRSVSRAGTARDHWLGRSDFYVAGNTFVAGTSGRPGEDAWAPREFVRAASLPLLANGNYPQTGDLTPGNIIQEKALQITADRPEAGASDDFDAAMAELLDSEQGDDPDRHEVPAREVDPGQRVRRERADDDHQRGGRHRHEAGLGRGGSHRLRHRRHGQLRQPRYAATARGRELSAAND